MKKYAFPLQLAQEAIFLGRYSDAIPLLKPLSSAGNPTAQFLHSYLYFWDDELSQTAAVAMMRSAAEGGHVAANYVLATCPELSPSYTFNLPITEAGMNYLRFAANGGSLEAKTDLAQCYLEGHGVKADVTKARMMLEEAYVAQSYPHHLPKTCLLLARMMLDGVGGKVDGDKAIELLFRTETGHGDPIADEALSFLIEISEQGLYDIDLVKNGSLIADIPGALSAVRARYLSHWQRYIIRYCRDNLYYDLRTASFETFVSFVFDHFQTSMKDPYTIHWTNVARVDFDARRLLTYYTRLFRNPEFLMNLYSSDELELGLGMETIRGFVNWSVYCVMMHPDNTVDEAEACIRSVYDLFAKLFSRSVAPDAAYMWWDIGYGACSHSQPSPRKTLTEAERKRLFQADFETMVRVLGHESLTCQGAALHGLGHSLHPDKENGLLKFLADHPDLSDGARFRIMEAIKGDVL